MADLIIQSVLKQGMNVSADLHATLGQEVDNLLEKAAHRTQENERRTVQPRDL